MNDPVVVHSPPTHVSKGIKINEVFKQGVKTQEPLNFNYNPKNRADEILNGKYLKTEVDPAFKTYSKPATP